MNYIVFDLEWNQCPQGKEKENRKMPFEIVEIGAIKLDSNKKIIDRFDQLIRPIVYKEIHFRTKEVLSLEMKELEAGRSFYKVFIEFLKWCGEDYCFCTWGSGDLTELQRNMKFYEIEPFHNKPFIYYDIQKLYSLTYEDGKSRKSLESAIDKLGIEKDIAFHRASSDAYYTSKIFLTIPKEKERYYSIDCFVPPKDKSEEIKVKFDYYFKYISREFVSKEKALEDKEVNSSRCFICGKNAKKKIKWFSMNQKNYYCIASCNEHGYLKGKIRMKHSEIGNIYVVKTIKMVKNEEYHRILKKQEMLKEKRKQKRRENK